jgi:hypothetical protein
MKDIDKMAEQYDEELKAKGVYSRLLTDAQFQATTPYGFLKMAIEYEDDGDGIKTLPEDAFEPLVTSLELRRTTRAEDETLCLSSIMSPLGLDVFTYLDISGENVTERRMVQFYRDIQRFDPRIIFNTYPRLSIDGFKWAPRSLIGHRTEELMRRGEHPEGKKVDAAEALAALKQVDGQWGLPVQYPGYMLQLPGSIGQHHKSFAMCSKSGAHDGKIGDLLNTYLPSNSARYLGKTATKTATRLGSFLPTKVLPYIPGRNASSTPAAEHLLVSINWDGDSWQADPHESYGLVLAHSLKAEAVGTYSIAVLGSFKKGHSAEGAYSRLSHICHATVQKRSGPPPNDVDTVVGEELDEKTDWFMA